jgi:hypothetical protein
VSDQAGRCATCKHFEALKDAEYFGYSLQDGDDDSSLRERARAGTLLPGDHPKLPAFFDGCCLLAEMPDEDDPSQRDAISKMRASSIDGSGYRGSLLVKLDFGCVQWEAKR